MCEESCRLWTTSRSDVCGAPSTHRTDRRWSGFRKRRNVFRPKPSEPQKRSPTPFDDLSSRHFQIKRNASIAKFADAKTTRGMIAMKVITNMCVNQGGPCSDGVGLKSIQELIELESARSVKKNCHA